MKIANAKVNISGDYLMVLVPKDHRDALYSLVSKLKEGYAFLEIKKVFRPRTTGRRSQENKFRGGCRDIADQIGVPFEEMCEAMKRMAVEEGYPTKIAFDGTDIPVSTSEASREEEALLIRVMHRYADEYSLYLTEYDNEEVAYKSVGGRTRWEMRNL